ncbi:MAG: hypothetical protein XXXJIFNMEKO3_01921 [Candidatus Erwinia impunctatus]
MGLGAGLFDELSKHYSQSVFLTSTRHPMDNELLCEFKEDHSHATDHLIYLPSEPVMQQCIKQARTLVLIDDEATTGNTFINLVDALNASGKIPLLEQIITVTLTDWSGDAVQLRSRLPVRALSLISGCWHWEPIPDAPIPIMPAQLQNERAPLPLSRQQTWGRLGMLAAVDNLGTGITTHAGEHILVLVSGEFTWQLFLLAERLEKQGASVLFSTTTRSPIATGFAIRSSLTFMDNYGLGISNFAYNVAHQQFDRILLCIETPPESVDTQLLQALSSVAPIVDIVVYE